MALETFYPSSPIKTYLNPKEKKKRMPPLRAWIYTIVSASSIIGLGALGLKFLTPSDEQFINVSKLKPETDDARDNTNDPTVTITRAES